MCVAIWVYIREKKTKHCYGDVKMEDKDTMKKRERNNLIEISEIETTTTSFHCLVCLFFYRIHVMWLKRTKFPNITLICSYMTSAFTSIDEYVIVFNFNFELSSISL